MNKCIGRAMWEKTDKIQKSFMTLFTSLSKTQKKRSAFFFPPKAIIDWYAPICSNFSAIFEVHSSQSWWMGTSETQKRLKQKTKRKKKYRQEKSIMYPMFAHWWIVYSRRITNKLFKSPPRWSQRGISLCSTPWHWFLPVAKDWDAWRLDTHTHTM